MQQTLQKLFVLCSLMGTLLVSTAQAQQRLPNRGCGTTENNEAMQQMLERTIPGYNRHAVPAPAAGAQQRTASQNYVIPIVFHVVHNGEPIGTGSNISDARILEQLARLNEDFAMTNADRTGVPSAFAPFHADMQIQFVLAQRRPDGTCFNGINRINRSSKTWTAPPYTRTYIEGTIKPNSFWNPSNYLNFWTVEPGGDTQSDGLLGYAQFPDNTAGLAGINTTGGNANTDGVVCRYSTVGNGGAAEAPYNLGRTATHEVGHWLGLRHIWGDGTCTASDFVADTPPQAGENYGCPSFPKVTCSASGPDGDMFMNYMDYTDDACMFMFTAGQRDRMQAVMAAGTPRRTSLATSPALPPTARVEATTLTPLVCVGSTILLNGTAPSGYTYAWTGPNNFSSTQQNPSLINVTLAAAGTYTLTATPAGGCPVSRTVPVMVRPLTATPSVSASNGGLSCGNSAVILTATPAGNTTATLINQTWTAGSSEPNWTLDDTGTGQHAGAVWATVAPTTTTPFGGSRHIGVDAGTTHRNALTRTSLYSPVFSAANVSTLSLTFKHVLTFVTGDAGKMEISTNGGSSWTTLQTYSANTGTATTAATATFNLNAYAGQTNLRLRWNYSSNNGGSWKVDDILVIGTTNYTYAWSLVSGNGMPASLASSSTLLVTPSVNSTYQVTVTSPGNCASAGATVNVNVPTATTWTGSAGNGDWDDDANWSPCPPTRNTTATIPSGLATLYPTISSAAEVNNLVQNGPLTLAGGTLSLFGNHTGPASFVQTGGTFVVAGTGAQSLRGLSYQQLTLNGIGLKTLTGNATASGAVTLIDGTLATGSYALTLNGGATLSETATSLVLGQVSTTETLTPGSSSSFRGIGATIAVPAGSISPGTVSAVRTTGASLNDARRTKFRAISRYYDLTPTVNTGLNLTLTLNYNAASELGDIEEGTLAAFRAVTTSSPYERMAGSLDMSAGTMTIPAVDHLSVWTLADAIDPLPVSLTSFEVQPAGADARLNWATATEERNDYFVVEVSADGRSFRSLGRVAGAGSSTQRQAYAYTDVAVARYGAAQLYYRLKQVDTDGTSTYSPVRSLAVAKGAETNLSATLWPNPSETRSGAPSLLLSGSTSAPVTLTLRDALGRVRSVRTVAPSASELLLSEAAALPAGLYVLEVQQAGQRVSLKVLRN